MLSRNILPREPECSSEQNGRHFGRRQFQMKIFENYRIPIRISLKFVTRSPIDNNLALVQVMAGRRRGDKPLPEPVLAANLSVYYVYGYQYSHT